MGEGAPLSVHCVMERVLVIVHDGKQFIQRPPLHHGLKRHKSESKYGPSFLDDLIKSVGVTGSDAAAPTYNSKEDGAGNNGLVKDLQHFSAYVEGSQFPQEVQSAHPFLAHSLCVRFPVMHDCVMSHVMATQFL